MSSLQNIKTRINTVQSTQKITKAMELVAFSKLKKFKERLISIKEYTDRIENVFFNLDANISDWKEIFLSDENQPRIFIIITSDLGLCGGYNSNVFKFAKKYMEKNDYIIPLGSKGTKWAENNFPKEQILLSFSSIGDEINYDQILEITKILLFNLKNKKVRSIHLIYTEYINSLTYNVEDQKIFPFSRTKKEKYLEENPISGTMEFEPSPKVVLENSLPLYINAILFSKIANSKLSEVSSRQIAMENATDNADEIMDHLQKEYNKIRQSKITQEISEIIAGAENE